MMLLRSGFGLRAVRAWLPDVTASARDAIGQGRISEQDLANTAVIRVPVARDVAAPEMAVRAARAALYAAGWDGSSLGFSAHAWIHHQGHDFWSPAHYIADQLGARRSVPLGIQVMCNGGGVALEAACARLLADRTTGAALVTTADCFRDEGFDRWSGDYGVFYGDGATAMLLHERDDAVDELTLLGLASGAVSAAEGLHRGRDPFTPASRWLSERVDVRRTKKAFMEDVGTAGFFRDVHATLRRIITDCLADCGLTSDDPRLRLIALPRVGLKVRQETYHPAVENATTAKIVDLGAETGHLGAGDMGANLAAIVEQDLLAPGEFALVIGAGGGFSFSCAAVRRPAA